MEDWQEEQIRNNLSLLVRNTSVNALFLAKLQQENVLSDVEVAEINAKKNCYDKSKLLYEIIVTKANSYYALVEALTETQQSGATKFLLHPSEKIRNLKVHFQGKTQQLGNLLDNNQIKNIQTWLLDTQLSEAERKTIVDNLNGQREVELIRDTIPKHYALYIPRYVSVAQIVDPNLFRKSCPDTFVFKNVERSYLSNFVGTYDIKSSTTQILQKKITARFILLESVNDWKKICEICAKIPGTPVHLLKYEEETEAFVVEATSGGSHILWEHLQHKHANPEDVSVLVCICDSRGMGKSDLLASIARRYHDDDDELENYVPKATTNGSNILRAHLNYEHTSPECISEEDFVEQIITENVKGACICDLPGKGKSDLLASLARRISEKCPKSITSFIQLRDFVIPKTLSDHKRKILDHISTSKLASQILYELTQDGKIQFNLLRS